MVVMTDADYKPAFNASCSFPIIESIILEKNCTTTEVSTCRSFCMLLPPMTMQVHLGLSQAKFFLFD